MSDLDYPELTDSCIFAVIIFVFMNDEEKQQWEPILLNI